MSFFQTGLPQVGVATGFLTKASLARAARTRMVDALMAFGLVILPMVAMIALLFLLGSAEPTTAVADAPDGTGMVILPP